MKQKAPIRTPFSNIRYKYLDTQSTLGQDPHHPPVGGMAGRGVGADAGEVEELYCNE